MLIIILAIALVALSAGCSGSKETQEPDVPEETQQAENADDEEERGKFLNWLKANRKVMNAGKMKPERVEKFKELVALTEQYRRKNQYE